MERKIITTEDGSHTISISGMPVRVGTDGNVTYHSIHGAIQESKHVFIEAGLNYFVDQSGKREGRIFEMGLGTGLNALLTFIEAGKRNLKIYYEAVDLFPLDQNEVIQLNYCEQLNCKELQPVFEEIHFCNPDKEIQLSPSFVFKKSKTNLLNIELIEPIKPFQLTYFDAFDPNIQPELWTQEVFEKLFSMLEPNGILVTYSSKGDVRRAMIAAGFIVEKIPGPKGKREMIRAKKVNCK